MIKLTKSNLCNEGRSRHANWIWHDNISYSCHVLLKGEGKCLCHVCPKKQFVIVFVYKNILNTYILKAYRIQIRHDKNYVVCYKSIIAL